MDDVFLAQVAAPAAQGEGPGVIDLIAHGEIRSVGLKSQLADDIVVKGISKGQVKCRTGGISLSVIYRTAGDRAGNPAVISADDQLPVLQKLGQEAVQVNPQVGAEDIFLFEPCISGMKARMVLNMVLEQAVEDGLIQKNPLAARSVRIVGGSSRAIEPYSVAQMRFLVQRLDLIVKPSDRAFLALHALHPLRPEEVLGLLWRDLDFTAQTIHIERAVTHPSRNAPLVKETKTQASRRTINLVPQIIPLLERGAEDEFVLGGEKPLSYSMVRKMCERIQHQTGFEERITPRRFRTTVLTDLYDATKDIKQAQHAAGHTTAAMTLKHYVKGREQTANTATPIAQVYGL